MAIPEFLRMLRRRWAIVAAVTVALVAAAAALTALTPTIYETKSTLFVSPSDRIDSYVPLLPADRVLDPVIDELSLDRSPSSLRSDVAIGQPPGSSLIEVTVRDANPQQAARIANAVGGEVISLVEEVETSPISISLTKAGIPQSATSPNVRRNLLFAFVFGLALGIAAAMFREILDTRVRHPDALRHELAIPLLAIVELHKRDARPPLNGVIPKAGDDQHAPAPGQLDERRRNSSVAEGYRFLRTSLESFDFEGRGHSILVASAASGEGRTTTAASLALTIGQVGESVVLVDGDLRRPTLSESVGLSGQPGLTDVLSGRAELDSALKPGQHLALLPAGTIPSSPGDLLASHGLSDLLAELDKRFDAVVIDSPPAGTFADAAILAARCGATLLVVRIDHTDRPDLERALITLEPAQARVCGFVANVTKGRGGATG